MRAIPLISLLCVLFPELAHCRPRQSLPVSVPLARQLLGLLGDDNQIPASHNPPEAKPVPATSTTSLNESLQPILATLTKFLSQQPQESLTPVESLPTSHSIGALAVSRLPAVPPSSSFTPTSTQLDPSGTNTDSLAPSEIPTWIGDVSATPPAELTQWKVIGIGVITVTLIAIIILTVSFFDSWWGFVRAVIFGELRRKGKSDLGEETLVPDPGQKKGWEFKLANENGHRYPTMASLESIVKEKDTSTSSWSSGGSVHGEKITMPELAYGV